MSAAVEVVGGTLLDLAIHVQIDMGESSTATVEETNQGGTDTNSINVNNHHGVCAICLNKIVLQETALVKGCEHAYCIHDYMFEESVCLLLRASWFDPLVEEKVELEKVEDYYYYDDDEEEDIDEFYLGRSSSLRIGNRRWGDNGYVSAGRQEVRPIQDSGAGPSCQPKKKESPAKQLVGRRAKRALKREAAAAKHQQHLARLGRM